jgi:hypothetical protein
LHLVADVFQKIDGALQRAYVVDNRAVVREHSSRGECARLISERSPYGQRIWRLQLAHPATRSFSLDSINTQEPRVSYPRPFDGIRAMPEVLAIKSAGFELSPMPPSLR